jgi:hypothetical protein
MGHVSAQMTIADDNPNDKHQSADTVFSSGCHLGKPLGCNLGCHLSCHLGCHLAFSSGVVI